MPVLWVECAQLSLVGCLYPLFCLGCWWLSLRSLRSPAAHVLWHCCHCLIHLLKETICVKVQLAHCKVLQVQTVLCGSLCSCRVEMSHLSTGPKGSYFKLLKVCCSLSQKYFQLTVLHFPTVTMLSANDSAIISSKWHFAFWADSRTCCMLPQARVG